MREILFRGKRMDNGEWVEGYYVVFDAIEHRIYSGHTDASYNYYPEYFYIEPSTVGQYTGLKDKTGKRIFEGAIISAFLDDLAQANERRGVVAFEDCGWVIRFQDRKHYILDSSDDGLWTVVGNIHDDCAMKNEVLDVLSLVSSYLSL